MNRLHWFRMATALNSADASRMFPSKVLKTERTLGKTAHPAADLMVSSMVRMVQSAQCEQAGR